MTKSIRWVGAALLVMAIGCGGGDDDGDGNQAETLMIGEIIARDADGVAFRVGELVTTEGIATADAGLFANNKVRQFIQDGSDGLLIFHATSSEVPSFIEGDRLRVTGVVGQRDPSTEDNRVEGTVLVDFTSGAFEILGGDNPVPQPIDVTVADIVANGDSYVGSLVRVSAARRTSGEWPEPGGRSSELSISDDDGTSEVLMRIQRNTIDDELIENTAVIGDDSFDAVGILVQDDMTDDGDLLDGYEIWPRGGKDITPR